MPPDELRELGEDIKKNGLQTPITVMHERVGEGECLYQLADGRNRLDAIQLAGFDTIAAKRSRGLAERRRVGMECGLDLFLGLPDRLKAAVNYISPDDPYAYVISANLHRRHLSAEQRRELIAKLIKATPEKSDRQIARTVKASPTTVGTVRAEMEAKGEVSKLDTRTDAKGINQPTSKSRKAKRTRAADPPPKSNADTTAKPKPRDDIGPASAGEIARKDAELEDLRAAKRRLEIENTGLCSEVEDLRSENAKLRESLEEASRKFIKLTNEFNDCATA